MTTNKNDEYGMHFAATNQMFYFYCFSWRTTTIAQTHREKWVWFERWKMTAHYVAVAIKFTVQFAVLDIEKLRSHRRIDRIKCLPTFKCTWIPFNRIIESFDMDKRASQKTIAKMGRNFMILMAFLVLHHPALMLCWLIVGIQWNTISHDLNI